MKKFFNSTMEPISQKELREALAEILMDPESNRLLLKSLVGTVFPIEGGMACSTLTSSGTNTTNELPKWTTTACDLTDSQVFDDGGNVGIGTTGPASKLDIYGGASQSNLLNATYKGVGASDQSVFAVTAVETGGPTESGQVSVRSNGADSILLSAEPGANSYINNGGNVGIGTVDRLSKFTVKGSPSFSATGSVSVTNDPTSNNNLIVTGTGTKFTSEVGLGDQIQVTITNGGFTFTFSKTVAAIASDTSLTVDEAFVFPEGYSSPQSGLTMTVFPRTIRADDHLGNFKFLVSELGFLGLAGSPVNDDDILGYVFCNLDTRIPGTNDTLLTNNNNEMRGYDGVLRYTRTTADSNVIFGITVTTSGTTVTWNAGPQFIMSGDWNGIRIDINGASYVIDHVSSATVLVLTTSAVTHSSPVAAEVWQTIPEMDIPHIGDGWDVRPFTGAVSLENMDLPSGDPYIRGQMKPFQSELYFGPKKSGGHDYTIQADAFNYVASLQLVDPTGTCTITRWAGYEVAPPCEDGGAAGKVLTGYGVWVQNLDDGVHTLVQANAAAIKLDGLDEYGRILWNESDISENSAGELVVRTAKLHVGVTPGADGIEFADGTLQTTAATGSSGFGVSESDDFLNSYQGNIGDPSAGTIGKLGWSTLGGNWKQIAGESGRPGIIELFTSSAANIGSTMYSQGVASNSFLGVFVPGDNFDLTFSIRVNVNDNHTYIRLGICDQPDHANNTSAPPLNGIYFEKRDTDTDWFLITRSGGTETTTDSGTAVSTNWVRMRIRRVDGTHIGFSIDGGTEVTQTANIPTAALQVFVGIVNTATGTKSLDIDYFTFSITGLNR